MRVEGQFPDPDETDMNKDFGSDYRFSVYLSNLLLTMKKEGALANASRLPRLKV